MCTSRGCIKLVRTALNAQAPQTHEVLLVDAVLARGVHVELLEREVLATEGGRAGNDGLERRAEVLELGLLDVRNVHDRRLGRLRDAVVEHDRRLHLAGAARHVRRVKTSPVLATSGKARNRPRGRRTHKGTLKTGVAELGHLDSAALRATREVRVVYAVGGSRRDERKRHNELGNH